MKDPAEYSRDYLVHYYEIDRKRRLTLPALMHYFEDIATLNSEARGFTLDRYARTGQLFLLLKWDIAVRSWPAFNETIRIVTRPTTFKRFLANREYAVFGKDGALLAESTRASSVTVPAVHPTATRSVSGHPSVMRTIACDVSRRP